MQFTKMHGIGNDYVYIDCFAQPEPANPEQLARRLANRHTGIGGDGVILICPSQNSSAKAEMKMYNADGSYSEMCGNGLRCVAKYLFDHGIVREKEFAIESAGQCRDVQLLLSNGKVENVCVDLGEPILQPAKIPTTLPGEPVVEVPLSLGDRNACVTAVSMGNPHCVVFVEELSNSLVQSLGPKIESDARFPKRTNVEFVHILSKTEVQQRTWERGSGETLACGSGACAVCVAGVLSGKTERGILVHLTGGDLQIAWSEKTNHVTMTGPAVEVFSGEIIL